MQVITLQENQWTALWQGEGEQRSKKQSDEFLVKSQQVASIIRTNLGLRFLPFEVRVVGLNIMIRATGVAGLFRIGSSSFQVQPKFIGSSGSETWQKSILHILHRVRPRSLSPFKGLMAQETLTFVDHIALAFIDSIKEGLAGEFVHTYNTSQQLTGVLQGRMDLARQLNSLFTKPHLLACEVDFLDTNNDCNNLIHWAINYLSQSVLNPRINNELLMYKNKLPKLKMTARLPQRIPPFLPSQYSNWERAVDIAVSLSSNFGHSQNRGEHESYGYLLNMEKLYEKFIEKSIAKTRALWINAGYNNISFHAQPHIVYAKALSSGQNNYYSIPDNIVANHGRPIVIIDAKYKSMADFHTHKNKRPQNSDIYQLFGALVAHGCKAGLLLYPKVESEFEFSDDNLRYWEIKSGDKIKIIGAVAIDMGNLDSVDKMIRFDTELFSKVKELLSNIVS